MNSTNNKEQRKTIILFLFVPLLLIFLFSIIPVCLMIYYSFTNWDGFSTTYEFIGFKNYNKLFSDDNLQPLILTVFYLGSSFFQSIIGLFLAVQVYFQKRFKYITLLVLLIPIILNTVAVGLAFRIFFMPGGIFDMLLDILHIIPYPGERESIKWIGNNEIVNYTLAWISVWRYTSYTFILTYGALLSVDKNIVKAAYQQGANRFQITKNILLPNIKTSLSIVIVVLLIGAISTVELPMIMTGGDNGTQTIVMRIQEIAFSMRDFGLASVVSLFVITIILIIIVIKLLLGRDNYE